MFREFYLDYMRRDMAGVGLVPGRAFMVHFDYRNPYRPSML